MGSVYSTRFILGAGAGGTALSYTVPAGFVAVVKDVTAAATVAGLEVQYRIQGTIVWLEPIPTTSPTNNGSVQWSGTQVLNAGETLAVLASVGASVAASGYLLRASS